MTEFVIFCFVTLYFWDCFIYFVTKSFVTYCLLISVKFCLIYTDEMLTKSYGGTLSKIQSRVLLLGLSRIVIEIPLPPSRLVGSSRSPNLMCLISYTFLSRRVSSLRSREVSRGGNLSVDLRLVWSTHSSDEFRNFFKRTLLIAITMGCEYVSSVMMNKSSWSDLSEY